VFVDRVFKNAEVKAMAIHERHSTRAKKDRLLRDIYEEVKQLRAATQIYTALVERVLSIEMANHAGPPATGLSRVIPLPLNGAD
jgi:predicted TIM-barrel fold metal-dependent hydrolase